MFVIIGVIAHCPLGGLGATHKKVWSFIVAILRAHLRHFEGHLEADLDHSLVIE